MKIYTHNSPRNYEATSIHMIVTDAPRETLNISDDWFEVDAEEVEMEEYICGESYPAIKGFTKLYAQTIEGHDVQKWGHM